MSLSKTLYPTKDSEVASGMYAGGNRGTNDSFWVGEETGGEEITSRGVVQFDLSDLASSTVVIVSAVLKAYAYAYSADIHSFINIYRNTVSWGEYTVTWNNKPSYNQNFGETEITNIGDKTLSLSNAYIQYWARSTWSNYGFTLKTRTENNDKVCFRSREYTTVVQRPRLIISYYDVPVISTSAASAVTDREATLNGNITSVKGNNVTTRGFQYGLTKTATWNTHQSGNYSTGVYSLGITSLTPNTTYWYRAYATNPAGTTYGSWVSFKTECDIPFISTSAASDITSRRAALNGNITSVNGCNATIRGFKYGLTETDTWDSHTTDSYGTGVYSQTITLLKPYTTYHFRAYATNSAGTGYGSWQSFKTDAEGGAFLYNLI